MGLCAGPKPVSAPFPKRETDPLKDCYSFEYQMAALRQDVANGKRKGTRNPDANCIECSMDTVWNFHTGHSFLYCCFCDFFYIHVYGGIVKEIKSE